MAKNEKDQGLAGAKRADDSSSSKEPEKQPEKQQQAAEEKPAQQEAPKQSPKAPYTVAPGYSITSQRGILSEGEEVRAEDLRGGNQERLDYLVKRGVVVKS